ncbi:hypothetical protein D9M71_346620 [compost metagenome]
MRHQQAPRAGATLAGGNERRLDNGIHRRIEVLDLVHHQRVVTPHFQGQDLVWAACELLMQQVAGAAGAGEEQAIDTWVGGQRHTGFTCALHQVQHTRRQAGSNPAVDGKLSDLGGELAGLEHHAVACQQRRHDMAIGQVPGEVVRAEHRHDAVRLVPQNSRGIGQRTTLFAGALAVALY